MYIWSTNKTGNSGNLFTIIKSIYYHYLQSYEFPRQNVLTQPVGFVSSFETAIR